jgi:hypothetical protein
MKVQYQDFLNWRSEELEYPEAERHLIDSMMKTVKSSSGITLELYFKEL